MRKLVSVALLIILCLSSSVSVLGGLQGGQGAGGSGVWVKPSLIYTQGTDGNDGSREIVKTGFYTTDEELEDYMMSTDKSVRGGSNGRVTRLFACNPFSHSEKAVFARSTKGQGGYNEEVYYVDYSAVDAIADDEWGRIIYDAGVYKLKGATNLTKIGGEGVTWQDELQYYFYKSFDAWANVYIDNPLNIESAAGGWHSVWADIMAGNIVCEMEHGHVYNQAEYYNEEEDPYTGKIYKVYCSPYEVRGTTLNPKTNPWMCWDPYMACSYLTIELDDTKRVHILLDYDAESYFESIRDDLLQAAYQRSFNGALAMYQLAPKTLGLKKLSEFLLVKDSTRIVDYLTQGDKYKDVSTLFEYINHPFMGRMKNESIGITESGEMLWDIGGTMSQAQSLDGSTMRTRFKEANGRTILAFHTDYIQAIRQAQRNVGIAITKTRVMDERMKLFINQAIKIKVNLGKLVRGTTDYSPLFCVDTLYEVLMPTKVEPLNPDGTVMTKLPQNQAYADSQQFRLVLEKSEAGTQETNYVLDIFYEKIVNYNTGDRLNLSGDTGYAVTNFSEVNLGINDIYLQTFGTSAQYVKEVYVVMTVMAEGVVDVDKKTKPTGRRLSFNTIDNIHWARANDITYTIGLGSGGSSAYLKWYVGADNSVTIIHNNGDFLPMLVINRKYIIESGLLDYWDSVEGKQQASSSNINFDKLSDSARGIFSVEDATEFVERYNKQLTDISETLGFERSNSVIRFIRLAIIVVGVLILVYAQFLALAFFLDGMLGVGALPLITFGGMMYATKEDIELYGTHSLENLNASDRRVLLVTPWRMILVYLIAVGVGASIVMGYVTIVIAHIIYYLRYVLSLL